MSKKAARAKAYRAIIGLSVVEIVGICGLSVTCWNTDKLKPYFVAEYLARLFISVVCLLWTWVL
ncbi:hypothetical protein C8J56DRAFT_925160 [Mycena floridula]|nr:hypothetical protein C8J56DRAFT_925160 [Mycena floridula]